MGTLGVAPGGEPADDAHHVGKAVLLLTFAEEVLEAYPCRCPPVPDSRGLLECFGLGMRDRTGTLPDTQTRALDCERCPLSTSLLVHGRSLAVLT